MKKLFYNPKFALLFTVLISGFGILMMNQGCSSSTDSIAPSHDAPLATTKAKILWQQCDPDSSHPCDIWIMNEDGSGAENLTPNTSTIFDFDVQWSPDHKKILFASDRSGNPDIWLMNADGSDPVQLTNDAQSETYATFTPDGNKIVFSRAAIPEGKRKLHIMNADGSNVVRLRATTEVGEEEEATVSPDGTKILFDDDFTTATDGSGTFKLYTININGSNLQSITPAGACGGAGIENRYPSWSPDGSQIVFGCRATGFSELYVMDADGSNVVQLTDNPGFINSDPSWSSDGKTIIFATTRDGSAEIYSMKPDGTHQKRLTSNSIFDAGPFAW